jgi:hypothetical protein
MGYHGDLRGNAIKVQINIGEGALKSAAYQHLYQCHSKKYKEK